MDAFFAFCPVEGWLSPRPSQHSSEDETEITLCQAMESVQIKSPEERPKLCFLCLENANTPLKNQIAEHTKHFLRKHVNAPWSTKGVKCNICGVKLFEEKVHFLQRVESARHTDDGDPENNRDVDWVH